MYVFTLLHTYELRIKGRQVPVGGAYSVVPPVWSLKNQLVASLSISGPVYRLSEDLLDLNIERVMSAAKEISEKIAEHLQ